MSNIINSFASEVTKQNKTIHFRAGTIFEYADNKVNTDDIIRKVAEKMLNDVTYIKNNLIPYYRRYIEIVNETINTVPDMTELSLYNIIPVNYDSIFNSFIEKGVINLEQKLTKLPDETLSFIPPEGNEIRNVFIFKPDAELKILTDRFVSNYSDSELLEVFNKYLSAVNVNNSNFELKSNDKPEELLLVMIALYYYKSNQPAYNHIATPNYPIAVQDAINYVSQKIASLINNYKSEVTTGALVRRTDKYTAYVNGEVYQKFLDDGGSADTILGYIVSGGKPSNSHMASDILSKKTNYINAWEQNVKLIQLSNVSVSIKKYIAAYEMGLRTLIEEDLPEDKMRELGHNKENLIYDVRLLARTIKEDILVNPTKVAKIVIADMLFKNKTFSSFIDCVTDNMDLNPKLDVKEAVNYASLQMLVDYFVEQIDILEIK